MLGQGMGEATKAALASVACSWSFFRLGLYERLRVGADRNRRWIRKDAVCISTVCRERPNVLPDL